MTEELAEELSYNGGIHADRPGGLERLRLSRSFMKVRIEALNVNGPSSRVYLG